MENHASQKDYKSGFGGEYGVTKQTDKAAHGWEHVEQVDKHQSQKGELDLSVTRVGGFSLGSSGFLSVSTSGENPYFVI